VFHEVPAGVYDLNVHLRIFGLDAISAGGLTITMLCKIYALIPLKHSSRGSETLTYGLTPKSPGHQHPTATSQPGDKSRMTGVLPVLSGLSTEVK